jgi:hypothetical protein
MNLKAFRNFVDTVYRIDGPYEFQNRIYTRLRQTAEFMATGKIANFNNNVGWPITDYDNELLSYTLRKAMKQFKRQIRDEI